MAKKVQYKPININKLNAILDKAIHEPWKHSFYQISRLINAHYKSNPRIGNAKTPHKEAIQFSQIASLYFAPRELAKLEKNQSKILVQLFGLGLLGPNGPLPIHFTEIVKERIDNKKDHTLAHFLDLFNHRYISLMYKAWAQSKPHVSLDRNNEDYFSRLVLTLTGLQQSDAHHLPVHAHLSMTPLAISETKSPYNLEAYLNHFFNVPFKIHNYALNWIKLDEEDYCYLGDPSLNAQLGDGATLGSEVPDCQSSFKITIGPMGFSSYMRFTPNSEDFLPLIEIVRRFIGFELDWQVQLVAKTDDIPETKLDITAGKLGWNVWLGVSGNQTSTMGMKYHPENYIVA